MLTGLRYFERAIKGSNGGATKVRAGALWKPVRQTRLCGYVYSNLACVSRRCVHVGFDFSDFYSSVADVSNLIIKACCKPCLTSNTA